MTWVCSCGDASVHVLYRRKTLDDKTISFWSNGDVTLPFGFGLKGLGTARNGWSEERNRRANRLICDAIGFYDSADLAFIVSTARKVAGQPGWIDEAAARARVNMLVREREDLQALKTAKQ